MATADMSSFLRRLTRGMAAETLRDEPDPRLVERLLAGGDEAAVEAIVRRHGPMVYRVCWCVLQQEQDTEDAFQATFLILAKKLRSVRRHASLGSWLHGVAHRVALKSRTQAAVRRRHEQNAKAEKFPPEEVPWREVRAVLDAELERLPEKWRLPLKQKY
jgi:RNA polymerase sigma factor (sigma-70 family)